MKLCTALLSFLNFWCLSQSEISTDNRKVSTFLHSNMLVACCLLSFLSGPFLKGGKRCFYSEIGTLNWGLKYFGS